MYYYRVGPQFPQFPTTPPPSLPSFPSTGFPPSQPSLPPTGFPPSQPLPPTSSPQQAPTAPPPSFVPQQASVTPFAVDPGAISGCLRRNTYVWLRDDEQFWFFPTFVGRNSVAGFRWNGRFWMFFGIDLRRISSFTCF
ncbi:collagen-like protein [Gottfriedia endophytica]|uniref:collagen-like protein n=1 Tax=Gottfriedia endophytica TaxID=2820819 RepID=UPI001FD78CA8|nr:collagen-like protein [Gottfriedia endophytica]